MKYSFFATSVLMTAAVLIGGQVSSSPSFEDETPSTSVAHRDVSLLPIVIHRHVSLFSMLRGQSFSQAKRPREIELACGGPGDECSTDDDCCSHRCLDMSSQGHGCSF